MDNLWNQQEDTRKRLREFINVLAQKWKDKPFDVLFVSRGKHILDAYPKNWRVVEYADQITTLHETSIFITHAGSNSFHEAVKVRVPMIAIPFFGDQPLVAHQIEKLGIGINLVPNTNIDTKKSKDFLDTTLAEKLNLSIEHMLNNLNVYKENLSLLSLESESVLDLLSREYAR